MTESDNTPAVETEKKPFNPALSNALRLGGFAIVAALVLGLTYSGTIDRINASLLAAERQALLDVVESLPEKNIALEDIIEIPTAYLELLGVEAGESIQIVRDKDNQVAAFIFPTVAPDGYSGDIRLMLGLSPDGVITGVRTIEHRETPGLGDKVDIKKSDWILSFVGKSLTNPQGGWAVTKDGGEFDAFTGATITPRAVVSQIKDALDFYTQYQDILLEQAVEQAADLAENASDEEEGTDE